MQADSLLTEPPGKPEKYTRQHQSTLGVTEECTSSKKKKKKKERKLRAEKLMLLNYAVGEGSKEYLGLQGAQTSQSRKKSVLNTHWKD